MNIIIYRCTRPDLLRELDYICELLVFNKLNYYITSLCNNDGFQVRSIDDKFIIKVIGYSGSISNMDGLVVDYFNSYNMQACSYLKSKGGCELNFKLSVVKKIQELMNNYEQQNALEKLKNKINSVYGIQSIISNFDNRCIDNVTLEYPQKSLEELKEIKKYMSKEEYILGDQFKFDLVKPEIEKVIFSGPCTIVMWSDGDKTIVRCENENFDKEKGLAMAIVKKFLGTNKNKSDYFDIFKEFIPEEKEETKSFKKFYTVKEVAIKERVTVDKIRKRIKEGLYPGAIKQSGAWLIPLE